MAFPLWRDARRIRLDFIAGAHKGAAEELSPGLWTIGGAADTQIRLGDPALADTRLTLDSKHPLGPRLRLDSGAATLEGEPMPLGAWKRAPRDARVALGREVFALSRKPAFGRAQSAIAPLAAGALGLAALAIGSGVTGAPSPAQPDPTRQIAMMARANAAEGAARELQARLNAAGAGALTVAPDSANGRVQVSGALTEDLRPIWENERMWFDGAYGARLALAERFNGAGPVAAAAPKADLSMPFAIRSVWTSPEPMIILQDGSRNRPGDLLPGGWRFVGLQDGDLHLERAGQIVAITP